MVYLAIALLLLVVIAPIFAVLPSSRQKAQMALRRAATEARFTVELTRIDDPDPDPQKYLSNTGKPLPRILHVAAYRMARPRTSDWRRLAAADWCIVKSGRPAGNGLPSGWAFDDGSPNQPTLTPEFTSRLERLPNDVVRVEATRNFISVYWNEAPGSADGGLEALAMLGDFVQTCALITPALPLAADASQTDDSAN